MREVKDITAMSVDERIAYRLYAGYDGSLQWH